MCLEAVIKFPSEVGCLSDFLCYDGLGGGVIAESRAGGLDIGRKFGAVKRFFERRSVFFGNDVVDRLFHCDYFYFVMQRILDFIIAREARKAGE